MSDSRIHAEFQFPPPLVHPKHPLRNLENHEKLRKYLDQRLCEGSEHRDLRIPRMVLTDQKVAGWMRLSDEEKEAKADAAANGKPTPTDVNLPVEFIHLDDIMTYYAQTFAPNRGMFYQQGDPSESKPASQIVTLMNNHAIHAGYYRELLLTLFGLLKYNVGGMIAEWETEIGPQFTPEGLTRNSEPTVTWAGNKVTSASMYNTLWDPLVHPTKLSQDGEYCAIVELRSRYWVQREALAGKLTNLTKALGDPGNRADGTTTRFFRHPPTEAKLTQDVVGQSGGNRTGGSIDWVKELSGDFGYDLQGAFEVTTIWIRLNPAEFGLIDGNAQARAQRNRYEIWRFKLLSDKWIVAADYMDNMHDRLPLCLALLNDDQMELSQRSTGEIMSPLQDFASFLLNVHMRATRKNIYGTTFYDSSVIDYTKVPKGEVNVRMPVGPMAAGKRVADAIHHDTAQVDTRHTMQDLESVMGLVNQFFPTSIAPSQIGDIDRAVSSQVAAVQQGSNRRNQKNARLIDSTLFQPMRAILFYNILQYQEDGKMVSDFRGKPIKVNLQELRGTDLPYIIGQGLMMLDRQAAASALQTVIVMLIQNPIAAQQLGIGIIDLLDYWVSLLDLDIDLKGMMVQQAPSQTPLGPDGQPIESDPTQELPIA